MFDTKLPLENQYSTFWRLDHLDFARCSQFVSDKKVHEVLIAHAQQKSVFTDPLCLLNIYKLTINRKKKCQYLSFESHDKDKTYENSEVLRVKMRRFGKLRFSLKSEYFCESTFKVCVLNRISRREGSGKGKKLPF